MTIEFICVHLRIKQEQINENRNHPSLTDDLES